MPHSLCFISGSDFVDGNHREHQTFSTALTLQPGEESDKNHN